MLVSSHAVVPATAAVGVLAMTAEGAGRRELAQLVTDHLLGHENRHVLPAVVDGDRVPNHPREDRAGARPGADDLAVVRPG